MSELFNKEDIFTIVNAEEARWYIGKKGYFASTLAELKKNISSDSHILSDILNDNASARFMYADKCTDQVFELFLPANKVKKLKKQWRPFKTIGEFKKTLGDKKGDVFIPLSLGDEITYRPKSDITTELHVIFNGYKIINNQFIYVLLGVWFYYLKDLFDRYEFLDKKTNQWKLFGVEE